MAPARTQARRVEAALAAPQAPDSASAIISFVVRYTEEIRNRLAHAQVNARVSDRYIRVLAAAMLPFVAPTFRRRYFSVRARYIVPLRSPL